MIQKSINLAATRLLPKLLKVDGGKRLSILIYHRVLEKVDALRPGIPDIKGFNWQMELVARYFQPMSLHDAINSLNEGTLPEKAVCVTFDDGYADNLLHALPVLQRWNIPATVFVSSGFLDGGRMWNDSVIEAFNASNKTRFDFPDLNLNNIDISDQADRLKTCYDVIKNIKYLEPELRLQRVSEICQALGNPSLPNDLMMTREQLIQLSEAGVEIGSHTVSHPVLTAIDDQSVFNELRDNTYDLQEIIQKPVRYFAYPNGIPGKDFNETHKKIVRDFGFEGALTTEWGVSDSKTDRWALPRFTPWDQTPTKFSVRMIMNMKSIR